MSLNQNNSNDIICNSLKLIENGALVDINDNILGYMNKLEAHKKGLLHRAISVFIFNKSNEMLLQRRSVSKYHTPGLWSNTACSHPRKYVSVSEAANRRLFEEMGLTTDLIFGFKFTYKSKLNNDLIENELDYVFYGFSNENPKINTLEVSEYSYLCETEIDKLVSKNSDSFTPWFKLIYKKVFKILNNSKNVD